MARKSGKQSIPPRKPNGQFIKREQPAKLSYDQPDKSAGVEVLPHVSTFASYLLKVAKHRVYFPPDECVRRSRVDSQRMRLDLNIKGPLEERLRSTALLPWHIEPENKKDPVQATMADRLTRICNQIPRFTNYRLWLLEGVFFGRSAIQNIYGRLDDGENSIGVADWVPVHGDKLVWDDDRNLGVMVGMQVPPEFKVEYGPLGRVHWFTPQSRPLYVVHRHVVEDGVFTDIYSAGAIHGIGIRSFLYWSFVLSTDCLGWILDACEKWSTGIQLWFFDPSNPESEARIRQMAEDQSGKQVLLVPRPFGQEASEGVEIVNVPMEGLDHVHDMLVDTFRKQIRLYIMGQTLSSEPSGGGELGGGASKLHADTKSDIVRFDSINLQETLTRQLLPQLARFNFPNDKCRCKFVIDVDRPDVAALMQAARDFWLLGGELDEDHLRSQIGLPRPAHGANVLRKSAAPATPFDQ